jgi:hypothetical protein
VIETLDEIATGASREFQEAREVIAQGIPAQQYDGQPASADQRQLTPEQRATIDKYRALHAELAARWDQRQLSPRGLRKELVKYYTQHGCQQLDERFGSGGK